MNEAGPLPKRPSDAESPTHGAVAPERIAGMISVIIPHYNDLVRLDQCLTCLEQQTRPRTQFEIIVCDNASPCGEAAVHAVVGDRARLIIEHERGAAAARNRAVREARGEFLAFTDSDCRPTASWLEEGISELEYHDVVGGLVRVAVEVDDAMTPTEAFEMVFAFRNSKYIRQNGFSVTASLFTRRETFEKVGPFRSNVPEDVDWCQRAVGKGFALGYSDRSIVVHPARQTLEQLEAKWSRLLAQSYGLARADGGLAIGWLARNWVVLVSIVPHLFVVATTPKLRRWRDRVRAAGVLVYIRFYRFVLSHRIFLGRSA